MIHVILCGGSGSRLWPVSRKKYPKQFCKLTEGLSLFQDTYLRNKKLADKTFVVTSADNYFLASEQIREVSGDADNIYYILEPAGRNTAPAIALAALAGDDNLLVTPADHLIKDMDKYEANVRTALKESEAGNIVTFGIIPQYPETGYGYIEADKSSDGDAFPVKKFAEKPDYETAKEYVDSGRFYWNSGMFCFESDVFMNELKKYAPEILDKSKAAFDNVDDEENVYRIKRDDMLAIPSESIDYAVMEHSEVVQMVPSGFDWSDIGSFDSLDDEIAKDESGNSKLDNHISIDSKDNCIIADRVVATVDVENLIIVDTPDALMVAKKGSSQKVKHVVDKLNADKDKEELTISHTTDYRPWGEYTVVNEEKGFKLKKITVKPGKRLSLQSHEHRSEHWVVVSGSAVVTKGDELIPLKADESVYIPVGARHRIENVGEDDLIFLEAQIGEKLLEDDITRYEDDFDRIG